MCVYSWGSQLGTLKSGMWTNKLEAGMLDLHSGGLLSWRGLVLFASQDENAWYTLEQYMY